MPRTVRSPLIVAALLLAAPPLRAQSPTDIDRPRPYVPPRKATRRELDHAESLKWFGLGLIHEKHNRLLEAVHAFEEARRLDPEAAPVYRALVPIYLALDRGDDALAGCRKALELDPGDYETGYLYARQLRARDRPKEALAVLQRTAACPGLTDHPDVRAQVYFDLGVLHEDAGDWDRAERCFRTVADVLDRPTALLQHGPYSKEEITAQAAETYERLGRICLRAGHTDRAIAAFQQAQKKDPIRAGRLAYNLAEVFVKQGRPREALAQLEDYLRTQPQGTEGYELRIKLQRQLRRDADVLPDLEAAVGRDRHNTSLRLLLAREYRRARRLGQAETVYEQLLREGPSPEIYRGLFALYEDEGVRGTQKALRHLDEAVKKATGKDRVPGDPAEAANARVMLQVLRGDKDLVRRLLPAAQRRLTSGEGLARQTRVLLATLAARTNQLDVAEALYRSCLDRPGGPRDLEQEVYAGLLRVLALGRKHAAIVALCEQGLEKALTTNRVLFHLQLAESHLALGHPRAAEAAADAAVNEAGEKERLLCRRIRAEVLSRAGKHDEAVKECQALLREYNQPGDVRDIRLALSAVYTARGDHARSEEQLQLILQADPNDATANNDLGYQWADRNHNLEEAERLIRKALELDRKQRGSGTAVGPDADQDHAAFLDSLGWVLFRRGRLEEACKALERASRLPGGSDDPVGWDHLGDVYFRLRQPARAGAAWKKAVGLYEGGKRRTDERYKEIQQKVKLLGP